MTHFLENPHISSLKVIRFTAITAGAACDEPLGLEPLGLEPLGLEPLGLELGAERLGAERLGTERLSRVVTRPTRPRGLGGRTQF
jgi:hypothetical protein